MAFGGRDFVARRRLGTDHVEPRRSPVSMAVKGNHACSTAALLALGAAVPPYLAGSIPKRHDHEYQDALFADAIMNDNFDIGPKLGLVERRIMGAIV